jgi:hypothetical protein
MKINDFFKFCEIENDIGAHSRILCCEMISSTDWKIIASVHFGKKTGLLLSFVTLFL